MTLPIFPGRDLIRGLAYSQKVTDIFYTQTAKTSTGASINVGLSLYPLHEFELTYAFLRDDVPRAWPRCADSLEYRTMRGFFLQTAGALGRFLYRDIDDCKVFQQSIGTGDGTTTTFTLIRTFGANGYGASEPVGQVDNGGGALVPFAVYLGGSGIPLSSGYTVSTANPVANTVVFTTAPNIGQNIAVDMSYFFYCKLADDTNTFEKFMSRLWMLSKVTLQSCRPGA